MIHVGKMAFVVLIFFAGKSFSDQSPIGSFEVVEGSVQVERGQTLTATPEMDVFEGDVVSVSQGGHAKILMSDENEIDLPAHSKLKIVRYNADEGQNEGWLELLYGQVRAALTQKYDGESRKFEVKTPTAVTGVRGTDFLTSYDEGTQESEVVSFSGQVDVGEKGSSGEMLRPTRIAPGFSIRGRRGAWQGIASRMDSNRLAKLRDSTRREAVRERRRNIRKKFEETKLKRKQGLRAGPNHSLNQGPNHGPNSGRNMGPAAKSDHQRPMQPMRQMRPERRGRHR